MGRRPYQFSSGESVEGFEQSPKSVTTVDYVIAPCPALTDADAEPWILLRRIRLALMSMDR